MGTAVLLMSLRCGLGRAIGDEGLGIIGGGGGGSGGLDITACGE